MKRLTILRLIATGAILVAIIVGCSGGGSNPTTPPDQLRGASNVILTLGQVTQNGSEISVRVEYSGAVNLRALSFRAGFDPAGLRPMEVQWGEAVTDQDSTFQLLDRDGFLPLALVTFDDSVSLNGSGTLCTLKFTVLDGGRAKPWIIPDPAYLVAKGPQGQPLNMTVGGESR
jgi:hypothetical protein